MKIKSGIILFNFIIVIIGLILLLPKTIRKTYAASEGLANTVISLSKGSSWSSGASGVYSTNDHEYRYVGANVNNFVSFNEDLYRIIGVFDDDTHGQQGKMLVKLIRSRKIGSYGWGDYNTSATSGTYSSYANDWTGTNTGVKANLNVLLNEFFYNKIEASSTYGNCKDWTYTNNSNYYKTNDCSDIIGYGIKENWRNYIQQATWHLNGHIVATYNRERFYTCERNTTTSSTCNSRGTTTGYIGLMYVSDYLYASGYYASSNSVSADSYEHMNSNWLYQGMEWTITTSGDSNVFQIDQSGHIAYYSSAGGFGVRPTFYLKSSVYVTGGDGSFDNPYTIACDDCG